MADVADSIDLLKTNKKKEAIIPEVTEQVLKDLVQ